MVTHHIAGWRKRGAPRLVTKDLLVCLRASTILSRFSECHGARRRPILAPLFSSFWLVLLAGALASLVIPCCPLRLTIQHHFLFFVFKPKGEFELVTYLAACAFIVCGADSYRRLVRQHRDLTVRLMDEQKFGKVVVEELAHRLKNKIATIQSIVSYQLRGQPELRDAIVGRLIALSGTDDLIMAAQGQGADLRDVLTIELGAYEASRVLMAGPAVFLPAKLALSMALLVHELATNAADSDCLDEIRR
jgi:hypothetical protein